MILLFRSFPVILFRQKLFCWLLAAMLLTASLSAMVASQPEELRPEDLKDANPAQLSALLMIEVMGDIKPKEVKMLIEAGADPNLGDPVFDNTALHGAAIGFSKGKSKLLAFLISKGADPSRQNKNGVTPLQMLCEHSSTLAKMDSPDEFFASVNGLAKKMKSLDQQDVDGQTVLHVAGEKGVPRVVEILLNAGANPNIANKEGQTPIFSAIASSRSTSEEIVKLLLAKGAKTDIKDTSGVTPAGFARACQQPALAKLFQEEGAPDPTAGADQCRENCRYYTGSFEMYNMDNVETIKDIPVASWSQLEAKLLKDRYLKKTVSCPDGGSYELVNEKAICSKHGGD